MENQRVSHYEIRRLIGRGGMGEVYEAVDLSLDCRPVALKFVAPELSADPESMRRFESEAFNAAKLNHPHIATIYGFEREGPRPFIAMELVTGQSLRDRIRAGPLPLADALGIARDIAAALALAHRRQVQHRDIKPENLMFDEHGAIKVMDFGLARSALATRLTMPGSSVGTPAYMAPEAIQGSPAPVSDVFSLGLVLHEMLTGKVVYQGDDLMAVIYAIANVDPPALGSVRSEVPQEVEDLVSRMLVKDPEQRPTAEEVARELAGLTGVAAPSGRIESNRRVEETFGRRSGRDFRWTVGFILGFVAIGAALIISMKQASARRHEQAVLLNNQGHAAADSGDVVLAQDLFSQALNRDPDYSQALMNLGALYRMKGKADSAAQLYRRVIRVKRQDPRLLAEAYYNLGDLDMGDRAWESAITDLERSVAADSTNPAYPNNLGLALTMAGRAEEALALLQRGTRRFPGHAYLWKNAGLAALQLGRDSVAIGCLDRALTLDARFLEARGLRARARARGGDMEGAQADWRAFLELNPSPQEREEVERELSERGVLKEKAATHTGRTR